MSSSTDTLIGSDTVKGSSKGMGINENRKKACAIANSDGTKAPTVVKDILQYRYRERVEHREDHQREMNEGKIVNEDRIKAGVSAYGDGTEVPSNGSTFTEKNKAGNSGGGEGRTHHEDGYALLRRGVTAGNSGGGKSGTHHEVGSELL